ncbi:MAG: hypothetical protein WC333_08430 [Dehalococcoidia bacterium]|jgi:hypothetical protein
MRMKRFSLLLLALVLVASIAVVGCGKKDGGEPTPTATATSTSEATATPTATQPSEDGYWEIQYKAVAGSYIVLDYSVQQITPTHKLIEFDESTGITFVMKVSKTIENGAREVIIPKATWVFPEFEVPKIMTGVDMDLDMPLAEDAVGVLYVEAIKGDVDMSSHSTAGQSPIQVDTYGDGTMDPAGSMLIKLVLVGNFDTSVGQKGTLPFGLTFTTGKTNNTVHITNNPKFDGTYIESEGVPFAQSGGVAPYVGTAGTIVTTGTGECLGIRLVGMRIDFQTEIYLVLEPAN